MTSRMNIKTDRTFFESRKNYKCKLGLQSEYAVEAILAGVMLLAIFEVFWCGQWLTVTDYSIVLDSVVDATKTPDGNLWVVDQGGSRILEVNPEYEMRKELSFII